MPSLLTQSQSFRRELLQRDGAAAAALTRAYAEVYQTIQARISELTGRMEAARARGETVGVSWLYEHDRLNSLLRQVEAAGGGFSLTAQALIADQQRQLGALGRGHALELILTAGQGGGDRIRLALLFARLPVEAIEELVGFLSPGTPLGRLLDDLAGAAGERVRQQLITAVALGYSPRRVAGQIRESLGGNLSRALTLSRTALMNSYRESSRRVYEENADVLDGWMWLSARGTRTCAACWALDGTVFPVTKPMPAHFNCRCTLVPLVKGAAASPMKSGPRVFAALSHERQREVLGDKGFAKYSAGVPLIEFAELKRSRRWGAAYVTRPVGEIGGRAA